MSVRNLSSQTRLTSGIGWRARAAWLAAFALLLTGCGSTVSGVLLDAASEGPVGNAQVVVRDTGWGLSDNRIVWDAEKSSRGITDLKGRFSIGSSGGNALLVSADGQELMTTSLCPRSPMIVRVGGPFARLKPDHPMIFRQESSPGSQAKDRGYLANVGGVIIRASGSAFSGQSGLSLESDGGLRFVSGTGAIPAVPPQPFSHAVNLDVRTDCGWVFVANGKVVVSAILVGAPGWEQNPGQSRIWTMFYSPLLS